MNISIIIVSWNVRDLLKKCLESIFAHTKENTPARGVLSVMVDQFGKPLFLPDEIKNTIAHNALLVNGQSVENQKQPLWSGRDSNPQLSSGKASSLPVKPTAPTTRTASDIISQFEIIVVDNASTDGTVEMVEQNFLRHAELVSASDFQDRSRNKFGMTVKLITNKENKGFAAANNQGIKEAKGEYILLLNPDTEFIENSLEKIIQKMGNHPPAPSLVKEGERIGVLGCKLLNPDKTIQPSVRRFPTIWSQLVILFKVHKLFPGLLNSYLAKDFVYDHPLAPSLVKEGGQEAVEVDQVMGAFFCVKKELFDKIGLLDEGYFIWFEEVDFCRRAKQAGYKVVYWPGTSVIHYGGQSFAQQMTLRKQLWFFKSAWRYFWKALKPYSFKA